VNYTVSQLKQYDSLSRIAKTSLLTSAITTRQYRLVLVMDTQTDVAYRPTALVD